MYLSSRTGNNPSTFDDGFSHGVGLVLKELQLAQIAPCRAIKISAEDGTSKHIK
jgi:hypothetical protein